MEKKTYTKPEVKVHELDSECAQICSTSPTSELKFCNEEGDDEQY